VVSVGFEQEWSAMMRRYNLPTLWRIPAELTYRGEYLTGFFGALFLLAPVALVAIRYPEGRRTLLAFVVFALPYPMNIGARFLIPAVPFLAIAMAFALSEWPAILTVVAVLHAVSSWPGIVDRYSRQYAWHLRETPVRAALRLEPEEAFLARKRGDYLITRAIEQYVPRGQRVWTPNGIAEAYTSRDILVSFQSSLGQTLTDMFSLVSDPAMQPSRVVRVTASSFRARQIRIEQTEKLPPYEQWSIAELRFYHAGSEIVRRPEWRITSRPNPWEIGAAFDNNPVTRWRSKQTATPGMYVEVDFGSPVEIDRVDVLTAPDSQLSRMRVLRRDGSVWIPIRVASDTKESEVPGFLGRPAMQEWKLRGAAYMMICDADWYAQDVLSVPQFWGLTQVAERGPCHLLRNDAGLPPIEPWSPNRERERPQEH